MARQKSKPKRWIEAAEKASDALSLLKEVQEEYQEWFDNLPEGLDMTPVAEKLEAVCDIDIEYANEIVEEAINADLPLGFGRD